MPPIHILMMRNALNKNRLVFGMLLADVSQEQAQRLTDGPDGWSILTILCHVRDYQNIYLERIETILNHDEAIFKMYDRHELIEQNDYAGQNLHAVFDEFSQTRDTLINRIGELDDAQWERTGSFEDGPTLSTLAVAIQALSHDDDHIEQIMRVLRQA